MIRQVSLQTALALVRQSALFDADWYLASYPDVLVTGADPVQHYLWLGRRLGRVPAPSMEPGADILTLLGLEVGYIAPPTMRSRGSLETQDSAKGSSGSECGVQGHPVSAFEADALIERAEEKAKRSVEACAKLFDARWYSRAYGAQIQSGCDPWDHFISIGRSENLQPNEYFSPAWYLQAYPDVANAQVDPTDHYVRYGAKEGRSCGPLFLPALYEAQLQEQMPADVIALEHFLSKNDRERYVVNPNNISEDNLIDQLGMQQDLKPVALAIGVVVYKQSRLEIRSLIASIRSAVATCGGCVSFRILIIDNAGALSADEFSEDITVLPSEGNIGFGRAQNRLMGEAFSSGSDVYIGANPDGAFHPDSILNLLKMNQRHGGKALIEALQFPEEHPKFHHPETLENDWCSGACFLLSRTIFEKTHGFDPNIFMYCEDVDLSWRVRLEGFRTMTCPTAYFFHDVSDRGYNPRIWMQMLVAGRYLAYKWQDQAFQRYAEQELVSSGFFKEVGELPSLANFPTVVDTQGIPNFSRMFSFSSTRW